FNTRRQSVSFNAGTLRILGDCIPFAFWCIHLSRLLPPFMPRQLGVKGVPRALDWRSNSYALRIYYFVRSSPRAWPSFEAIPSNVECCVRFNFVPRSPADLRSFTAFNAQGWLSLREMLAMRSTPVPSSLSQPNIALLSNGNTPVPSDVR